MKKWSIMLLLVVITTLYGCKHEHQWEQADCVNPAKCADCGATDGKALGHEWNDATCTSAKKCQICKKTKGDPLGHEWEEATCKAPKTCSVCGEQEGKPLEHEGRWITLQEATMTQKGSEELLCVNCADLLDTRETDMKLPGIEDGYFNFASDAEFIQWFNSTPYKITIDDTECGETLGFSADGYTAYFIKRDEADGYGLILLRHENNKTDGRISSIVVWYGDDAVATAAIVMVIGYAINKDFSPENASVIFMQGDNYSGGGMRMFYNDYGIALEPV